MVPERCRRTPTLLLFVSLAMAVAVSGACADDDKATAMRTAMPKPVSRRAPTASPAETVVTPSVKEKRNTTPSRQHGTQDTWTYDNVAAWPATCAGNQQSPMPLRHTPADAHRPGSILTLLTAAKTLSLHAVPDGSRIALLCDSSCGVVKVNGVTHEIKNMHWHTPSEHTIDGRRLDAELHLVAFAGGKIAVLSSLFKVSKKNALVGRMIRAMSGMGSMSATRKEVKDYFFSGATKVSAAVYKGSLTTPPCTEGLSWVVTTKVSTMSKKQLSKIRELLGGHDNARPLQPPMGRFVEWVDVP